MASTQIQCNGARGQYFAIVLDYVLNSQSVADNTSNVTITGKLKATDSAYSYYGYTNTGKLLIDGVQKASGSSTDQVDTTGVTLFTYTGNIAHSSDGTKTATLRYDFTTSYGNLADTSLTVSWTLNTIARASLLSIDSAHTLSTSNLAYTITSAGDFYHTLTWKIGNTSTTIYSTSNPKRVNATTFSGSVSDTDMLAKMPTSTSATVTFTLKTYKESACTTQIGSTVTATCALTVDSSVKPTITISRLAPLSTPIANYMVAGYSTAQITYSYTNSPGATSMTVYFTANKNVTFSTPSSVYTDAPKTKTRNINTLPSSSSNYTFTVTVYAVDSRGIRSDDATYTSGTVYGYSVPKITGTFKRVASSGSTTADPAGLYVYCSFSGAVSSTINNQNTIQSTTCKQDGITTITNNSWVSLAETDSATFNVTVTDKVASATKTYTVGTAKFPIDLYDSGNGTVGVGFGATAEANKVRSSMPIVLNQDKGIKTYDSGDNEFNMLTYNGTNMWMGARTNAMAHFLGKLYLSSGYNTTDSKGNDSAYIAVPNGSNTNASYYKIFHEGYNPLDAFSNLNSWTVDGNSYDANNAPNGLTFADCTLTTNLPWNTSWCWLIDFANHLQIAFRYSNSGITQMKVRGYTNNQWYPWTTIGGMITQSGNTLTIE